MLCNSHAARSQTMGQTLWQIGPVDGGGKVPVVDPDKSSQYPQDALYVIGVSKPEADWSFVQPGPRDGWAGQRSHTSEIYFCLPRWQPRAIAA